MGNLVRQDSLTPEAVGFLSAAGVFIILPAVLFHFINKKLCFEKRGGPPCVEQQGRQKHYRETSRDHESLGLLTAVTRMRALQKSSLNYK
ncbi:hypothetical protein AV530_009820 [Patagioenas fasciata monilis]|uniref:Uncharacterized protein n=1 Tax=Patagioenas fasciata monilis TaxID=372326 RepID=A0A1V4KA54_PATFA|nr:hypothetical protein AV530_009820 [Patagioenas fasciata monilis]